MANQRKVPVKRNETINALIIYNKVASALNSSNTLQLAARRANLNINWNVKPWRIDVLKLSVAWEEALMEAVEADLIVFAGVGAYSLPDWLGEWLECWAKRRHVDNAAVALIHEKIDAQWAATLAIELSRFAAKHGLDLLLAPRRQFVSRTLSWLPSPASPSSETSASTPIQISHRAGIND